MAPKKKLPTGPINILSPVTPTADKKQQSIADNESIAKQDPESKTVGENNSLKQETRKQEDRKQESRSTLTQSSEITYKKVAMRLSETSVIKLRDLKADIGLPYEVIVDCLIQQWDDLGSKMRDKIILAAQAERANRLIAGQEKATKTTIARLKR